MSKKILHYVSGSRADFGLMKASLLKIKAHSDFDVGLVVTGQNTNPKYGSILEEISKSGLSVLKTVPVALNGESGLEMTLAMSQEIEGLAKFWEKERPDIVLILGDRGEALSAAIVAVHLCIHVVHIHGGERSGTLDESFRHAISKLAHFHFVSTRESAERLIKMGEKHQHVFTVGAPGLVLPDLDTLKRPDNWLSTKFQVISKNGIALVVYHPVVQEAGSCEGELRQIIACLRSREIGMLILRPNSDFGGARIESVLSQYERDADVEIVDHIERHEYLACLLACSFLIGNSSSGIIEAASLSTTSVNVGSRQNLRQSNSSTFHCPNVTRQDLMVAIDDALSYDGAFENVYGDGNAWASILQALASLKLDHSILKKSNVY